MKEHALEILRKIGLESTIKEDWPVSNQATTVPCIVNGTKITVEVTMFKKGEVRVEVIFILPETAVLANTYMQHCAHIENIPKNHAHHYCAGPRYRDYSSEMHGKNTFALSPWNDRYFYVRSEKYMLDELDKACDFAAALAKPFVSHLGDLQSLRFWNPGDKEVLDKAKEIIANADLHETDSDPECKAHWLEDRNSFIKGWFYPFNDRGKGTFDTIWPSSVDYAAKTMGNEGTFEYAVSCNVLVDADYIAKARKACFTRKKTVTIEY